jgi:alpha-ketoglutaric semialdehyde dehydrogenase
VVNAQAMTGVTRYVEAGRKENATFCAGGDRVKGGDLERGFFFQPTVIEAKPEMEIAREEIFGPVLSVIRARGLREAIEIANAVRYGLTASIFTRDVSRVFRFADRAQAGIIHVNRPGVGGYSHAPFGGVKESGYGGREVGDEVLNFYTETKAVYINYK